MLQKYWGRRIYFLQKKPFPKANSEYSMVHTFVLFFYQMPRPAYAHLRLVLGRGREVNDPVAPRFGICGLRGNRT